MIDHNRSRAFVQFEARIRIGSDGKKWPKEHLLRRCKRLSETGAVR
jgi:hypothetical protein